MSYGQLVLANVIQLVAVSALVLVVRRAMSRTAINRAILVAPFIVYTAQLMMLLGGSLLGLDPLAVLSDLAPAQPATGHARGHLHNRQALS